MFGWEQIEDALAAGPVGVERGAAAAGRLFSHGAPIFAPSGLFHLAGAPAQFRALGSMRVRSKPKFAFCSARAVDKIGGFPAMEAVPASAAPALS